ncbi:MAG: YqeG family HAD IIIA-type phosphatase [Clostridia bacterium]|nr:YqeG family HAD IIIA-type phosphatase [Clostridia bacterium]
MILEKKLMPDMTLGSFVELTPDLIKSLGADAVISDIDNTLAPYEDPIAPPRVVEWVNSLVSDGIALTLVSNNKEDRVARFCRGLPCAAYSDVKKPSVKYILLAVKEMGTTPEKTVFLGDQLLTDALAAHRAGMRAVIVPPIKDKKTLFFKFKRAIEKPYMKKYEKIKRTK